jgi:sortase A
VAARRTIEGALVAFGVLALIVYAAAHLHRALSSRIALEEFQQARRQTSLDAGRTLPLPQPGAVDFSLWSQKRIARYRESLATYSASPVAVLKIPKIHLEVPVFEGTDELTLNRGVGLISGTATPGQPGNIGIAGHRDGFFRGLKQVVAGDSVELITADDTRRYVVDTVRIVAPEDVSVLEDKGIPLITLVTCYPFYFVGSAPQRWIVQCSLRGARHDEDSKEE